MSRKQLGYMVLTAVAVVVAYEAYKSHGARPGLGH